MRVSHFPLLSLLCLLAYSSGGQEVPHIRNFTPAAYGAQNQNWSLAQCAATGYLYVGNNAGLLEFDGARWQPCFLPEGQTVRAVATGADGTVYGGGFGEFGYWQPTPDGRLLYTSLSDAVRDERLAREEIWNIVVTPSQVLFQSFSAVYQFDFHKVSTLHPPGSIMFAREVQDRILLPVIGLGIYEILPDRTFRMVEGSEKLSGEIIQFLVPDGRGGVWAGTTDHGLFVLRDGQCLPWPHALNAEFRRYQLNKAISLKEGGWAIGTILNGVYILNADGSLRYHLHRENGLQNNTVLALSEDRDGNLWVGLDRGIDFVGLRSPLTFFTDQTGKIGTAYAAAQHEGWLYLGTNQGVFVAERKGPFRLVEGTQGQVWDLQVQDGQLLCGHNSGTFLLRQGRASRISDITGGWCTVPVPQRQRLLLQSTYTGLVVLDQSAAGDWHLGWRVQGFAESLKKIVWDSAGYLWGSHAQKGLYRLRLSDDLRQVTEWRAFGPADGLPTDYHLDVAKKDGDVVLNVRPSARLIRSDQTGVHFVLDPALEGMRKWLGGLGSTFFALDSTGGLQMRIGQQTFPLQLHLVPEYERVVALPDSTCLFCLENGYARMHTAAWLTAMTARPAARVVLRSMETQDGQSHVPVDGLTFEHDLGALRFRFALPAFEHAPLFSWRLEGFSEQWSAWQESPEQEFFGLPPGDYSFRVRAKGVADEAAVRFSIAPAWYVSAWAWAVYALLALLLLWGIEWMNRRRWLRQRERIEQENARELSRQRTEAEREKLLLEVDNQSRELSNAALNLIRKNEAILRLKDELLAAQTDQAAEPRTLQRMVRHIDQHLESDHDWALFEDSFNRVHDDFFKRLMQQFPELTPGDLRLAAYLKMNLSSKEIAPLLNISVRGVENKRYRLRKKLGLPEEANLAEWVLGF